MCNYKILFTCKTFVATLLLIRHGGLIGSTPCPHSVLVTQLGSTLVPNHSQRGALIFYENTIHIVQ